MENSKSFLGYQCNRGSVRAYDGVEGSTMSETDSAIAVNVTVKVTEKRIQDLLGCAFEGGIGYWACIVAYKADGKETRDRTGLPQYPYLTQPLAPGGAVILVDRENRNDKKAERWTLDREAVQKGLQVMATDWPEHWANFIKENEDATTGDVFVQCALFGKLVYS